MAKGRIVFDVWKDHQADPFFWIELGGIKNPIKVYYGREGWIVELNRQETRAIHVMDNSIRDSASRVAASIDISGPMDEILVLIEYAGYHGSYARTRPAYVHAPRRALREMSEHLATFELLQELAKNLPAPKRTPQEISKGLATTDSLQKSSKDDPEKEIQFSTRQSPLDRPTRYKNQAHPKRWNVVTGRHSVLDIVVQKESLTAISLPETTEER